MDFRLGLLATSLADLRAKLEAYLESGTTENVYEGRASRDNSSNKLAEPGTGNQEMIREWLERPESVLQAWVNGITVDWQQFYIGRSRRRVSLPTYPFARHRHWIGECGETNEPPGKPETRVEACGAPAPML
jgi:acyl transferase domain-containing protein